MDEDIFVRLDGLNRKEVLSDMDYEFLAQKSKDEDCEVRSIVAQILGLFPTIDSKIILKSMLFDEDELVRADVCDSFSSFVDSDVLSWMLCKAEQDKDNLVQCYAIFSARDIVKNFDALKQKKAVSILKKLSEQNCNKKITISANSGLYILGEENKLENILESLNEKDYSIRCFAINVLLDVVNCRNRNRILCSFTRLKDVEKDKAVISALDSAIELITALDN